MNCRRARALMPLAAGGDGKIRAMKRLETHLSRCPTCRTEFRSMRSSLEELKRLAEKEPIPQWPEAEWQSLMKRLTAQPTGKKQLEPRRSWVPLWVGGATTVVLLATAVLWLAERSRHHSPSPRPATRTIALPPRGSSTAQTGPPRISADQEPAISRPTFRGPAADAAASPSPTAPAPSTHQLVFISSESGLTVHWILDSEFEWKENIR